MGGTKTFVPRFEETFVVTLRQIYSTLSETPLDMLIFAYTVKNSVTLPLLAGEWGTTVLTEAGSCQ
jgi:hypothetical protein